MPDCPSPAARPADAAAIPDPAGKTRTPCITEKAGEASSASAPQSTFMAWLVRMSLIRRWALMLCIRPENVSEHSHQTAVIAHLLAVIRNRLFGGHLNQIGREHV